MWPEETDSLLGLGNLILFRPIFNKKDLLKAYS